jgi:hypothetical protein
VAPIEDLCSQRVCTQTGGKQSTQHDRSAWVCAADTQHLQHVGNRRVEQQCDNNNAKAAATTGSTLGSTYQTTPSNVPHELAMAINTLAANQQLLFQHIALLTQHMAVMLLQVWQPTQSPQPTFHAPIVQHLTIPGPALFAGNGRGYTQGYNQGRSGQSNG